MSPCGAGGGGWEGVEDGLKGPRQCDRQRSIPEGRYVGGRMRVLTELGSWLGGQCLRGASAGGVESGQLGSPCC